MKIERENIFLVGDILCKKDCRFGLTTSHFERCCHVDRDRVEALAQELVDHERNSPSKSELFAAVELQVDDPHFWQRCLEHAVRASGKTVPWMEQTFVRCAKSQLLRMSGKVLTSDEFDFLLERIHQLLQIHQSKPLFDIENDIKYWLSNLKRTLDMKTGL